MNPDTTTPFRYDPCLIHIGQGNYIDPHQVVAVQAQNSMKFNALNDINKPDDVDPDLLSVSAHAVIHLFGCARPVGIETTDEQVQELAAEINAAVLAKRDIVFDIEIPTADCSDKVTQLTPVGGDAEPLNEEEAAENIEALNQKDDADARAEVEEEAANSEPVS